jgi:AAA+ ATPase superfamily predicted ATPase
MIINIMIIYIMTMAGMRFHNRKKELSLMRHLTDVGGTFLVIHGRRRVGKTALMLEHIKDRKGVYLYLNEKKSTPMLLEEFEEEVRRTLGVPDYVHFSTWNDLLAFLVNHEEDIVVIIDEFQRLLQIDPSFYATCQKIIDTRSTKARSSLIVSGSSTGMMRKIFYENGAPLFKRADNIIELRPFRLEDTRTMLEELGVHSPMEMLDMYTLFGGVPFYYQLAARYSVRCKDEAIEQMVLGEFAPLRSEVREVMVEEFGKEHATYFEILAAMAVGKESRKEIADLTHVSMNSLTPYLNDLIDVLGIVNYEVPVGEDPHRSKRGRHVLADNFFRFHFRYLYRHASLVQGMNFAQLRRIIDQDWPALRGVAFEDLARGHARAVWSKDFPEIGRSWDRRGSEVDIVCLDRRSGKALMMEAKAAMLSEKECDRILTDLERKRGLLPFECETRFGIYALGFEDKEGLKKMGAVAYDLDDVLTQQYA